MILATLAFTLTLHVELANVIPQDLLTKLVIFMEPALVGMGIMEENAMSVVLDSRKLKQGNAYQVKLHKISLLKYV